MAIRTKRSTRTYNAATFLVGDSEASSCVPPRRLHTLNYHRPRLLDDEGARQAFLTWFDSISKERQMPWRKDWLSPSGSATHQEGLPTSISKRAYEVWVSEIMLQQTRVSVVIPYFDKWIAKWPTVQDLAAANQDEVLAAWKGLGYYSRATRLREAAQQIVQDMEGALPAGVDGLLKIKGIGRYTAGAVSSIAFGRAVPLLDGNVGRVLCRQMGLHARVKDKKVEDVLWEVADILVKQAAQHDSDESASDVPGRWNQGLMELGSTICTPKPKCEQCPIQSTCAAYAEGSILFSGSKTLDIEDSCQLCEPLELEEVEEAADEILAEGKANSTGRKRAGTTSTLASRPAKIAKPKGSKQRSLRDFASFAATKEPESLPLKSAIDEAAKLAQVIGYCSLFPKREAKKSVPEEDCIVCIIKHMNGKDTKYLVEQRPSKGLLASLWQFPTYNIPKKVDTSVKDRKAMSTQFVRDLLDDVDGAGSLQTSHEKGSIIHVFSHLKLHMHIHTITMECENEVAKRMASTEQPKRLWLDKGGVDLATLSTGMKRCWEHYLQSQKLAD